MGDYNTKPKEKTKEEEVEEQKSLLRSQAKMIKVEDNTELAQMYKDNALVGAENLSGELPLLKVHTQGKSSTNLLADGSKPQDGYFFYKPLGTEYKTLDAHILTISRGFRAKGLEQKGAEDKIVFNQIIGGVFKEGNEYRPFLMYMSGKKLQPMWDFGKEASKYTRAKPIPVPMFALTVKLTTESEKNDFGESWLVKFKIEEENGAPVLITDPGEFTFLKDNVQTVADTIAQIIAAKEIKGAGSAAGSDEPPLPDEEPY